MFLKKITVFMALWPLLYLGCAADPAIDKELAPTGPVISIDVDDSAKLAYLQNVKSSIKSYQQVLLDLKYYHGGSYFEELVEEIERYIETYVDEILLDTDSNSSVETRVEVAKIHLLVIHLFMDVGYKIKPVEYLELFHDRYDRDQVLLEKSLNPEDVGCATLGQGLRILEERAYKEMKPVVHGKVYPWKKSRGKIYPWRNPEMEPYF